MSNEKTGGVPTRPAVPQQQRLYSESELALLRATFFENAPMLYLLRKVFYGFELTGKERALITSTFTEPLRAIMHKMFLPTIRVDAPIGRNIDLWGLVDIVGRPADTITQVVEATTLAIRQIEAGLQRLANPKALAELSITYDPRSTTGPMHADLIARNTFIPHVESRLVEIQTLAATKPEASEAEQKERAQKDSSE